MSDPLSLVLLRLDSVCRTHLGWVARCPTCGEPESLRISYRDDGRHNLRCDSQCSVLGILDALDVSFEDWLELRQNRWTMPEARIAPAPSEEKAQFPPPDQRPIMVAAGRLHSSNRKPAFPAMEFRGGKVVSRP